MFALDFYRSQTRMFFNRLLTPTKQQKIKPMNYQHLQLAMSERASTLFSFDKDGAFSLEIELETIFSRSTREISLENEKSSWWLSASSNRTRDEIT